MDFTNYTEGVFATGSPGTPPRKILLTLTLSVLAVLTTVINCLVITAIIVTRKLHHPANYLICSLAVTDLLVAVLVMPFSIVYIQREAWVMGQLVCTVWLCVDITCCTCSILHLAAIAIDRYRAITDAVEYSRKRTGARAGAMVAVVWLLSFLISLPPLLWRHHNGDTADEYQCTITHHHIAFTLYSTLGAFYIPLLLLLILYYKIYRAAQTLYMRREASRASSRHSCVTNGSMMPSYPAGDGDREPQSPDPLSPQEKSGSSTDEHVCARVAVKSPRRNGKHRRESHHVEARRRESNRSESRRKESCRNESYRSRSYHSRSHRSQSYQGPRISGSRERRAASTLGLILGAFVICWLPFFVKEVIVNTCDSCTTSTEMADFLTWLGYLNSLINPLIYTVFNEDFKKAFQRLVRCSHYL